jgi:hypothetical protein
MKMRMKIKKNIIERPDENDKQINKAKTGNLKPIISCTTKFTAHHYNNGDYCCDTLLACIISLKIGTKALKPIRFIMKPVKLTKCKAK